MQVNNYIHESLLPNAMQEARDRLRSQALQDIASAQERVRSKVANDLAAARERLDASKRRAQESLEEARARIAAADAAALAQVRDLVARYKRGEYVAEQDIEWAFRVLEEGSWRR